MKQYMITFLAALLLILCVGCGEAAAPSDTAAAPTDPARIPSTESQPSEFQKKPESSPPKSAVIPQDYAMEDFLTYHADELLFSPQSEDYIMTERYWQGNESYTTTQIIDGEEKPVEKPIVFHITRIYEFDERGTLVAQREKYTFQTDWTVPKDVYYQDMAGREGYTNVKLVEQVIYADVEPSHLDTGKTKQQMVDELAAAEEKYYMSKPVKAGQ